MWIYLTKCRKIIFLVIFLLTALSYVNCKQKSETILISDATNGRQFVLSENSKEKKIVIRNNYKPCEKKTDRIMNDGSTDQQQSQESQLQENITNKPMNILSSNPSIEMPTTISYIPDTFSDRLQIELQDQMQNQLRNHIQNRASSFSTTTASKSKHKKHKTKGKDVVKIDKQKLQNTILPSLSSFAHTIEPILKTALSVNNQLGYSYPVYIPDTNPLSDYLKQRLNAQRLIEHPIIYSISESENYPLFLSQFNVPPSPQSFQLKTQSPGLSPLAYPNRTPAQLSNLQSSGILHDYAYINALQNQLFSNQYQQTQLINHLIPQIIQSTITKKPINLISGSYPDSLMRLPTYQLVNFQSPNENVLENSLFNKPLDLFTKDLVYSNPNFLNGQDSKSPKHQKNHKNNKKISDSKKDYKEINKILGNDYHSSYDNQLNSLTNNDYSKDYPGYPSFGKDYLSNFGKETDYFKDYTKEYHKDYFKDYSKDYQKDNLNSNFNKKVNKSEPYFRLPILFRKTEDKFENPKSIKYPLFSPKDALDSSEFFPFNDPITRKSTQEDNEDSFKPIISYSKLISGVKHDQLDSNQQIGDPFNSIELKDFDLSDNSTSTDYFSKPSKFSSSKLQNNSTSTPAEDTNSLEFDY